MDGAAGPTDLLLTPGCLLSAVSDHRRAADVLPADGGLFDMHSWCFRHEPSPDPARMQCFRVREFVRMGSNEQVLEFRQAWLDRAQGFVTELALPYTIDIAQ